MGEEPLASLIPVLSAMRLVANFLLAAVAMFVWDYILTFGMEVDLVWKSRWNFMKVLYLVQRYMPFIDTVVLFVYYTTGGSLTKTSCQNLFIISGVMSVTGVAASEMILALRAWAVWNRNKHLAIIISILYPIFWGTTFFNLHTFLSSITHGDPPFPGFKGCFLTHANKHLAYLWASVIVWDTLMLFLMLVPGIRAFRFGGKSTLITTVYRDGVVYYLYIFTLSFINVIVVITLPSTYQLLLASAERVLRSMLASRVLLSIRAQSNPDGLTELNTNHLRGEMEFSARARRVDVSTTRSSLNLS